MLSRKMMVALAAAALLLAQGAAQASKVVIDDFSADTSANYNAYSIGGGALAYGRTDEQFEGTSSTVYSDYGFLYNGGLAMSVGDTVSIDIDSSIMGGVANCWAGLAFNTKVNGTGTNAWVALYKSWGNYQVMPNSQGTDGRYDTGISDPLGTVTMDVTRTASNVFAYSLSGGNLTETLGSTMTVAGLTDNSSPLYFGMYACNGTLETTALLDNLAGDISPIVPEPGTMLLCVSGLLGLLAYAWRRRR